MKLTYLNTAGTNVTGFDRFGRVADQVWKDYGANPGTLDEYTYTYDRAGNRLTKANTQHNAFSETYTYDNLDRLATTTRNDSFDQSWTLDGLGNISAFDDDGDSQTRTANSANEITAITGGSVTPTYDAAGNMKFGPKSGDETTGQHYVYDAWNRLVKVYEDDGDGVYEPGAGDTSVAQYKYDGANRRIEKVVTGTSDVHYYYNQQWQMLEERFVNGGGATVASNQYVWSPRYVDSPILRFHDGNGDGDLLDAGDNTRYYTTDANFNVTATIDAGTGAIVERYVYNAYGKATVYDSAWSNPAAPTTDGPLYCGYFFDAESGLYQVRNRYYDSGLSAFINRDPIESDPNLYRHCGGNPLIYTDPSGMSYREVTCTFCNGSDFWSETVAAETAETASQACRRRAVGWGWGTAWKVMSAREGPLNGNHQDHGGTYESDYSDLAVTKCNCQKDAAAATKECKAKIGLRAAGIQVSGNLTGLGEGALGVVSGSAGTLMVVTGTLVTGGWILIAGGIGIGAKGVYDFYVTAKVGAAALAAADRYCNCAIAAK